MSTPAKVVLFLVFLASAAGVFFWRSSVSKPAVVTQKKNVRIGLLFDSLREERWQKDRDLFVKNVTDAGGFVDVQTANLDADVQYQQAENLIAKGIKTLVVVPYDGEKAAAIVELAHKNGAKVLSYDRLIKGSPVDFYVSFDNEKVGELEANGVLSKIKSGNIAYIGGAPTDNNSTLLKKGSHSVIDPLVQSGAIKLVVDEFTEDWRPENAYLTIKKYLQTGKTLDGVIAANDGTAGGAIRALKEVGLAGKIPVSGQDAELAACQRIIAGTQTLTVYKPISAIAKKAAEIAIHMAEGVDPVSNSTVENGAYTTTSYLIEPIAVDKSNIDKTIIKDGYHAREQIYGK